MDYNQNEQRIAQQLAARNLSKLYELLLSLKGFSLNSDYTLRWLYAIGGQSILYLAERFDHQRAIVKMPLLDYHRPAYISIQDIQQARQHLEKEGSLLRSLQETILPKFYDLIHAPNPLYSSARDEEIVKQEPYLIMELIEGLTLIETSRFIHRQSHIRYKDLESLAWKIAKATVNFSLYIFDRESQYIYSDFTPLNVLLTEDVNKTVRIIDAGSLIPLKSDDKSQPPFTLTYIPPEYYEAFRANKLLWPTPAYMMYSLGKVLWEFLTNRQPYPAEDPDLNEPKLKNYSSSLQNLISNLIQRKYDNFSTLNDILKTYTEIIDQPPQILSIRHNTTKIYSSKYVTKSKSYSTISSTHSLPKSLKKLTKIREHRFSAVQKVRYSPDGNNIALTIRNNIELRSATTFLPIIRFRSPHTSPIISLDFDVTGSYLASGCSGGKVCLWYIDSEIPNKEFYDKSINGLVALDAHVHFLAAATEWGANIFDFHYQPPNQDHIPAMADAGSCVAISKSQSLLAIGGLCGIKLWDLQKHIEVSQIKIGHETYAIQTTFSDDGCVLAALCLDASAKPEYFVSLWHIPSCNLLSKTQRLTKKVNEVRLDAQGQHIFISSSDNRVRIYNQEQDSIIVESIGQERISSLDYAPKHQTLIVATIDGKISTYRFNI